ncbi:MAG: hypothetical protein PUG48_03705 [Clostridia bacterium]|nr:hypothetical protein [Clostridia bacterium]
MNKKNKASIFVLFSVIITLIMATGIMANAEYDEYGNYYEPSTVSAESSQVSLSSIDTSELTSEDWKKVEENLNSTFHTSTDKNSSTSTTDDGDFKSIKDNPDTSNDSNDTWIYLLIGLVLITVGVAAIVFVIATTVHTKNAVKAQPRHSANNKPSTNNNNKKTDKK